MKKELALAIGLTVFPVVSANSGPPLGNFRKIEVDPQGEKNFRVAQETWRKAASVAFGWRKVCEFVETRSPLNEDEQKGFDEYNKFMIEVVDIFFVKYKTPQQIYDSLESAAGEEGRQLQEYLFKVREVFEKVSALRLKYPSVICTDWVRPEN